MDPTEGAKITADMLEKGGGWGLFALAIPVMIFLAKGWRDEASAHLNSWRDFAKTLNESSLVLARWTESSESRNRALEASVRGQDLAAAALAGLTSKVDGLSGEVRDLREDATNLRTEVLKRAAPQ